MYKYMIAQASSGKEVYVNLISSLAGQYLSRNPHVITLIKEALAPLNLKGPRVVIERDMGRTIGNTDIVSTSDKDTIYYAQAVKAETFSRFAKNRLPQPSQMLTMILEQDADGDYEIRDTWVGPSSPPFPGDNFETADSKPYWESHALVQDALAIQSKTITKDCPY